MADVYRSAQCSVTWFADIVLQTGQGTCLPSQMWYVTGKLQK